MRRPLSNEGTYPESVSPPSYNIYIAMVIVIVILILLIFNSNEFCDLISNFRPEVVGGQFTNCLARTPDGGFTTVVLRWSFEGTPTDTLHLRVSLI